ncbi:MAG: patatin-like phospholipase family protein [Acidimicrobiales bacterium]|jgi:NTE family protein|nr:patatin [Actinomycetes bacterium]MEE1563506.1 patatin-like phospholipase family protein [Acidimicrobiales bacterium]|tara:strand:+ start:3723 stop:4709 length:987 start_codon:yes stop_codon:yes gene_type:complete
MITVGLVLSAGGMHAAAHHAGVLSALTEATGWDPRTADVIVGTSAGATSAITLRAGLGAADQANYYIGRPLSPDGQALVDRVTTPYDLPATPPRPESLRPANPLLVARGMFGRGRPRPVVALAGLLPEGTLDGTLFRERAEQFHPARWPDRPTWICAVDLDSGRRVVFGRDDVDADIGTAVQASCAVPGFLRPVESVGHRYVDGGIHSTTNADLLTTLGLDLVVVSSSMTAVRGLDTWPGGPLGRAWHSRTLVREVEAIRRRGTAILVLEPTAADLALRGTDNLDPSSNGEVCETARISTLARLAHPASVRARGLLATAAAQDRDLVP